MNLEKVASQIIFRFQHATYTTFCQTSWKPLNKHPSKVLCIFSCIRLVL